MHTRSFLAPLALAAATYLASAGPASAVKLEHLQDFPSLYGRYGPGGDCAKYPQVLIDATGFALDRGGGRVERAPAVEYSASFFGPTYEGMSGAFWPYWSDAGGNPILVITDHDEKPGALVVEPHDFGWPGGPPMPERFRDWLRGSPYAKCG